MVSMNSEAHGGETGYLAICSCLVLTHNKPDSELLVSLQNVNALIMAALRDEGPFGLTFISTEWKNTGGIRTYLGTIL